jgi:hypothetical protein
MKHTIRLLLTALAISGVTFATAGTPSRAHANPPAIQAQ